MSSDLFSDDQLAQGISNFECSFASGFDVDANSAMVKLCAGRKGSVAKTCFAVPGSRHPSVVADRCWTRGNKPPQESLQQSAHICWNSWFIAPTSGRQWMCATKKVEDAPS